MKRVNEITLFIGRRATGKTTFTKKILPVIPLKKLVVDMFDHPDYSNFGASLNIVKVGEWNRNRKDARIFGYDFENLMTVINTKVSNCCIVFEDSRRYIEPVVSQSLRKLIIEHRNKNIDLIFQFHNLQDVPPYLCSMHNRLILFKTNDNVQKRQSKYSNWDEIAKVHQEVMKNRNPFFKKIITLQ